MNKSSFLWSLEIFARPASCSLRTNQPRASAASARGVPTHHKACGQCESHWNYAQVRSFSVCQCLLSKKLWVQWLHLKLLIFALGNNPVCLQAYTAYTCHFIMALLNLPHSPNSPCLNISCIISRIARILCPGNQEWCNMTEHWHPRHFVWHNIPCCLIIWAIDEDQHVM